MRIARTAAALGFRRSDRQHLAQALKHVTMVRAYKRLQAVRLVAAGRAVKEVAQIEGVSDQTIYNWVNCYLHEHATAALFDEPRAGRHRWRQTLLPRGLSESLAVTPCAWATKPPSGRFRCSRRISAVATAAS